MMSAWTVGWGMPLVLALVVGGAAAGVAVWAVVRLQRIGRQVDGLAYDLHWHLVEADDVDCWGPEIATAGSGSLGVVQGVASPRRAPDAPPPDFDD